MLHEIPTVEREKKINRVELSNGVYFDVREKSRGAYEIVDLGQDGKSHKGMTLEAKPKKRQFEDIEDQTTDREQWDWAAGSTTHFKYKDTEFDFTSGGGEIHAPSLKEIRELSDNLEISIVDPADRDF